MKEEPEYVAQVQLEGKLLPLFKETGNNGRIVTFEKSINNYRTLSVKEESKVKRIFEPLYRE